MKKSELKTIITNQVNDIMNHSHAGIHSIHIPTDYEHIQVFIILGTRRIENVILSVTNDTDGLFHRGLIIADKDGKNKFTHPSTYDSLDSYHDQPMSIQEYLDIYEYSVDFDFKDINKDRWYKQHDIINTKLTIDSCFNAILSVADDISKTIENLKDTASICRIER